MSLTIVEEPIPLQVDVHGVVRVGWTRVTLDTVVSAFIEGATPEEIVSQYPVLSLADVYAVIGYYLRRRSEVEAYLKERKQLTEEVQRQNETRYDLRGVRNRLLVRRGDSNG